MLMFLQLPYADPLNASAAERTMTVLIQCAEQVQIRRGRCRRAVRGGGPAASRAVLSAAERAWCLPTTGAARPRRPPPASTSGTSVRIRRSGAPQRPAATSWASISRIAAGAGNSMIVRAKAVVSKPPLTRTANASQGVPETRGKPGASERERPSAINFLAASTACLKRAGCAPVIRVVSTTTISSSCTRLRNHPRRAVFQLFEGPARGKGVALHSDRWPRSSLGAAFR